MAEFRRRVHGRAFDLQEVKCPEQARHLHVHAILGDALACAGTATVAKNGGWEIVAQIVLLVVAVGEPSLWHELLDVVAKVLGVAVDAPRVGHDERVGRDEEAIVHVVFLDAVRDRVCHDGAPPHRLAQESIDVGQLGPVNEVGQAVWADDLVQLGLGLADGGALRDGCNNHPHELTRGRLDAAVDVGLEIDLHFAGG